MILIVLYLQAVLMTFGDGVFISLRERNFTGEDKRLRSQLARRMRPRVNLAAGFSANLTQYLPDMKPTFASGGSYSPTRLNVSELLVSGRRQADQNVDYDMIVKSLDMIRQCIYRTRLAYGYYEGTAGANSDDDSEDKFRIGVIFSKLEQWEKEIRAIHQASKFHKDRLTVRKHIYYYEHCFRRTMDVTFTLQYLYTLHHNYMEKKRLKQNVTKPY